jgi:hypothetical protein
MDANTAILQGSRMVVLLCISENAVFEEQKRQTVGKQRAAVLGIKVELTPVFLL